VKRSFINQFVFIRYLWVIAAIWMVTASNVWGQNDIRLEGVVLDRVSQKPIDFVTVYQEGTKDAVETDQKGQFSLLIPQVSDSIVLIATRIGYKKTRLVLQTESLEGQLIVLKLRPGDATVEVVVKQSRLEESEMITETAEEFALLPSTTGNIESILPSIALGVSVSSGGELSSQYNVRGGNYDENLVYVNDFEIYRPQLVRSGQQEGLSFPNPDLMQSLSFSSGGFTPQYGDKMSSVMDITYKRPDSLGGSFSASFLGATAHLEGRTDIGANKRPLRYLIGARYKTNAYLLNTLDVQGEYIPNFFDLQSLISLDLNDQWQIGTLLNYNQADYRFEPISRSSAFGLIDFALKLTTAFQGAELTTFRNYHVGGYLRYLSTEGDVQSSFKLLLAHYQSLESETFDIIGDYRLSQIETDLGSDDFGTEVALLGDGTQHINGRNFLNMNVTYMRAIGALQWEPDAGREHYFSYGATIKRELIDDQLKEWERLDSAGYSLSYDPNQVLINTYSQTETNLESYRFAGFLQDEWVFDNGVEEFQWTYGLRATYWTLNEEWNISPRTQLLFRSDRVHPNMTFKLASGYYVQPPLYREMRDIRGQVNTQLQAQKSWQILAGWNYDFRMLNLPKPFRLIVEGYYKRLWDIVPYDFDNVRIRYSGQNEANGYVMGLDARINGEFVPGVESWVNLSILAARENFTEVQHLKRELGDTAAVPVNYVPRPTDRPFSLSMFFQDYLPMNERFRTHVMITVSSGLPFGLRDNNEIYRNPYRFRMYQRVDIGFSYQLWQREWRASKPDHWLRNFKDAWVSLEVFNLLQIQNEASNTWIKTITNRQFAVPNYLSSRRINLRFRFSF